MDFLGRLNRISLLLRAFFRFFASGKANKIPNTISCVVVVPTGKMGDLVCNTPVFRTIREKFPSAKIVAAGNVKALRSVYDDSGLVDEYVDIENKNSASVIKNTHAQAALITGPSFGYVSLAYISGIPLVVAPRVVGGFSPAETFLYKILKKFITTFPYEVYGYAPGERLKALEPLGIVADDTTKQLGYSQRANEKIENFFKDHGVDYRKDFVVGICPTAGNKIKEWPEERFAQVANYIAEKHNAAILIIGGPRDEVTVSKVAQLINHGVRFTTTTDFTIGELKAFISKLHLVIAVDTGHIYIAEAFNVPTIDIVGPVDERVQPPRGRIHRNVLPPNRTKAEVTVMNSRSYNEEEAKRQVLSISAEDVIKEIEIILKEIGRV